MDAKVAEQVRVRRNVLGLPDTYWRSLKYFSIYRLILASVFVLAATVYGDNAYLGYENIRLFRSISGVYVLIGVALLWVVIQMRRAFNLQLTVQVFVDVIALTLLMYAGGGAKSGIGVMLFVVLAGAGLVGQGRMALFYAALATLAVLCEQAYHHLRLDDEPGGFLRAGLTSIGFFATAITARLLARRIVTNETLAWQRGVELANQLQINQRVIRDMQDGVLVVDAEGRVRQHNPQAEAMLNALPVEHEHLATYSVALAERFAIWVDNPVEAEAYIRVPGSQRTLRVRLLPPGEGEHFLIYLEDMGRVQEQAQQLKLAALGRLTANMAHEIRNPLSAISHAAELLADDRGDGRSRLIRIIGDNTARLNRLVAEILELGRRDRAQAEPIRLSSYLPQFIDDFAVNDETVRDRVAVTADEDAVIEFDRAHLHRVLWNLLINALRHCGEAPGAVRISARSGGSGVAEIHIVDDGPGIGDSLRGQIFEPFFTTHGTGTGLGLYIAKELCEANGARLEFVENSPGAHFAVFAKGRP